MSREPGQYGNFQREDDGTYAVVFERRLVDPPERVWRALTDPDETGQWFVEMTLDPRPGGRIFLDFGEEGSAEGEVRRWEPPQLLEHTWQEAGNTSLVRWELGPDGDGTRLTLRHSGLPGGTRHEFGAGWHDFLDRLPLYLAGEPADSAMPYYEGLAEEYLSRV